MTTNDVPSKYLRNLLLVARAQRVDTDRLCLKAGLSGNPLSGDCPQHVDARTYSQLYSELARELDDECFGFYRNRPMPFGSFALLCRVLISCSTLEQALRETDRFFAMQERLRGAPGRRRTLHQHGDSASLRHPPVQRNEVDPTFLRQNGIAGSLSSWHRLCNWLIGTPIALTRVDLRDPPEVDLPKFERIFRCPIRFEAEHDALYFPRRYLEAPVTQGPEQLAAFLPVAPYQLVALREIDADRHSSISFQVNNLLSRDSGGRVLSFDEVAELMDMPARTLRRRLEQEGTSFQNLKDNCRRRLASALLSDGHLSVAAVAEKLGFDEPSAFHRAFKRWTGQTPGQYREQRCDSDQDEG